MILILLGTMFAELMAIAFGLAGEVYLQTASVVIACLMGIIAAYHQALVWEFEEPGGIL